MKDQFIIFTTDEMRLGFELLAGLDPEKFNDHPEHKALIQKFHAAADTKKKVVIQG